MCMRSKPNEVLLAALMICFVWYSGRQARFTCPDCRLKTSPDSGFYFEVADSIRQGRGLVREDGTPETVYAPLYPLALSLYPDNHRAAWLINQAAFYLTIPALFYLLLRLWPSTGFAFLGVMFAATSPAAALVYRFAWSEPLFLLLTTAALACLAMRRPKVYLAGLLLGLAFADRIAGVAAVVVAGGFLVLYARDWKKVAGFLALAGGPMALWFLRNLLVSGAVAERSVRFTALPPEKLVVWALWLGVALVPALCGVLASRAGQQSGLAGAFLLVYPLAYVLFIGATVALVDPLVPVDARIMAPMYFWGLPTTVWALAGIPSAWRQVCVPTTVPEVSLVAPAGGEVPIRRSPVASTHK